VGEAEGSGPTAKASFVGAWVAVVKGLIARILGLGKLALVGICAALLLVCGGGGYFLLGSQKETGQVKAPVKSVFYGLPDMTVNPAACPERPQYLRVKITLEAENSAVIDAVKPVMPRVIDAFQVHLRELRVTDLEGSAGLFRLREELTRRVNLAI